MRVVAAELRTSYQGAELYAQGMIYSGLGYTNILYNG